VNLPYFMRMFLRKNDIDKTKTNYIWSLKVVEIMVKYVLNNKNCYLFIAY